MSILLRGRLWDGLTRVSACDVGGCRAVGDAMLSVRLGWRSRSISQARQWREGRFAGGN